MINITFKNVDQGDSIIVEWKDEKDVHRIGIIDCNLKKDKSNPVLDYLIKNSIGHIEFIILSHPHSDHFSGLRELLEYAIKNKIVIKNFLHTCHHVEAYIKTVLKSIESKKTLFRVFKLVKDLRDNTGLRDGFASDSPFFAIPIIDDINLTILSPTSVEIAKYAKNQPLYPSEEESHNPPNANWLSTITKIGNDNWYILLTSDCEKYSLVRIDKKRDELIKGELILAQAPHHGSLNNHNNTFWKKRKRQRKMPIIFSVGKNGYGHPNKDVVDFFLKENFDVYSTNHLNGVEVIKRSELTNTISNQLDVMSQLITSNKNVSKLQGDKSFSIGKNGIVSK